MPFRPSLAVAAFATLLLPMAAAVAQGEADFDEARRAWDEGNYPAALHGFERLLTGPAASRFEERIALLTGELYRTREITVDGRNVRLSPSGKWVAFERGAAPNVWTHFVAVDGGTRADSAAGTGVTFDALDRHVALLRRGRLVIRDLGAGTEREVGDGALSAASPSFTRDGSMLFFIARQSGEGATHVFSLALDDMRVERVTTTDTLRADLQVLGNGRAVLFVVGRDPFAAGGRGGGGGGGRGGGGRGGGGPRDFVVRDLASGSERRFTGVSPSLSADGGAVAYMERRQGETLLYLADLDAGGEPVLVKRAVENMEAPAIAPDGESVAFSLMPREDWEVYVVGADGRNERRVTREIQHDRFPRWLTSTSLLAMVGEGRHTRSYLHDVAAGTQKRFFHNNTVRTVAPEYEWAVSADGNRVAIVAERDGDTVSPERGVYVVDLPIRVTRDELLARVRGQLAAEVALRAEAGRRFDPVTAEIRAITGQVSRDRIYRYARDLFLFDSKHITQPGNARAIAYLDSVYKSFGYETELQWFERNGIRTANVVATLRGTVSPDAVYVVGSHFDSVAGGPGADDNTSGTTMLLETARVLAKHPLPATVTFVSFTGEEAGLLGSREFVRRMKEASVRLVGAMNNDMMGWSNDQRLDNTIRYSNPGIRDIQHGAALQFSRLITYDALYYKSTDAAAFYEGYGDIVGGFGSYPILGNPHYHQRHDVLETINFEQMAENTKANVATMMMLAMAPSRVTGLKAERTPAGVTVTWDASPEKDIREYVVRWRDAGAVERTQRTATPRATLPALPAGASVSVKAVNRRGLDGWDWATARL
jgi:Tol biopolymer transport system component